MSAMRICTTLWMFVGLVWLVFALRRKETQERAAFGQRLGYGIPAFLAFYLLFGSDVKFDWLQARVIPPSVAIAALGIVLTAIGVALAVWARLYIGANWSGSVTVKVGHELVRSGPYAWVRHPIYSGLLLATLGTALVRGDLRGLLALPILWWGFWFKSRIEESFMLKTFGSAYEEYSRSTGALIPRVH